MLSFDTRGIEQAVLQIERFHRTAPLIAGTELVAQVRDFAALGKAPDGSQWKGLSPAYARLKQKKFGNHVANKKATGRLLASVVNRNMIIAPSADQMAKAQGLEKKRVSFEPAQVTANIVEAKLLKFWNASA